MQEKIEEARREFNAIVDYILQEAMGRGIHQVEEGIYRMLMRLGRILLELFVLAVGTGKIGPWRTAVLREARQRSSRARSSGIS